MIPYHIPQNTNRTELIVNKSQFITTVGYADSPYSAKQFVSDIKQEMPNANHHVYAFRVGYDKTVTEGMSDDGEPTGTAGPPSLAVIRGTKIGDIVAVTTRYFGGKKLGTGGLVKAYTQSLQYNLESLELEIKVARIVLQMKLPYHLYDIVNHHMSAYELERLTEEFTETISLQVKMLEKDQDEFIKSLTDKTSGQIEFVDQT